MLRMLRYLRPIYYWHRLLRMQRFDLSWHRQDMADELSEYYEAEGLIHRWSELADVVYTHSRTTVYDGYRMEFPLSIRHYVIGLPYMYGKYSLRWLFYRIAGSRLGYDVRAVLNPAKEKKIRRVAQFFCIHEEQFVHECMRLRKYWLFLP